MGHTHNAFITKGYDQLTNLCLKANCLCPLLLFLPEEVGWVLLGEDTRPAPWAEC